MGLGTAPKHYDSYDLEQAVASDFWVRLFWSGDHNSQFSSQEPKFKFAVASAVQVYHFWTLKPMLIAYALSCPPHAHSSGLSQPVLTYCDLSSAGTAATPFVYSQLTKGRI